MVTTSLRGLVYEEVTVDLRRPRSAFRAVRRRGAEPVAGARAEFWRAMHDDNGRVTIPGFYDGVNELPADIKADLAGLDLTAEDFLGRSGSRSPAGEKDRMLIEQIATRPTAEINGIIGGYTGEGAKTVIPGQAMAKVSFRLVGDAGPAKSPRSVPRLREGAAAGRCQGRVRKLRRRAGDSSCRSTIRRWRGPARRCRRMGQEGGHDGRGRLDPDRRRLQARARHGYDHGRLCARRRPRAFAEREVRSHLIS